ncbi:HD domain-containing protein [Pseudodesulfovibrio sp.]|uniref:HD domain-containing protein n=1 Tax=Pseudodesulfovibrio sp. TaxID=2035812 RepID=UPI0026320E08|nr:HD domain-containing protein [Pseudodesulfovibrio sp.]MDD3311104.1 HD domain-containing protein [Pseudodesulfovibrio sp.]
MAETDGRDRLTRIVDFLNECGMLRKTPRTGYQFLGSGSEDVAQHSFRTAVIGHVLALMAGADVARTTYMCLFHDLHEARTGDFNYVNRIYNKSTRTQALEHATRGTGLEEDVLGYWKELEETETLEAKLAQDADQIDFILNLKEEWDQGNRYAGDWLEMAVQRVRTEWGRKLAETVARTDHKEWWFLGPDRDWWTRKNGKPKSE